MQKLTGWFAHGNWGTTGTVNVPNDKSIVEWDDTKWSHKETFVEGWGG